jgi:hypothetical protein
MGPKVYIINYSKIAELMYFFEGVVLLQGLARAARAAWAHRKERDHGT